MIDFHENAEKAGGLGCWDEAGASALIAIAGYLSVISMNIDLWIELHTEAVEGG